jgi:hypothetical protein
LSNIASGLKSLVTPIDALVLSEHNARRGDVDAISRSYERFGQRKPIVAHKDTKEIIAGNHQYQAALALGWSEIAVVFVDDDAETAVAYAIADNRIGQLGDWDVEELVSAFDLMDPSDLAAAGFEDIDVEDFRALYDELHMEAVPAVSVPTGKSNSTDGVTHNHMDKSATENISYDDYIERYANRSLKSIVLYYPGEDYSEVITALDFLSKRYDTKDHAETVQYIIEKAVKDAEAS